MGESPAGGFLQSIRYGNNNQEWFQTHNVPGVDAQAAEQSLVAVGPPPLVPEAHRLVDVLKLRPHAATRRPAATNENAAHKDLHFHLQLLLLQQTGLESPAA